MLKLMIINFYNGWHRTHSASAGAGGGREPGERDYADKHSTTEGTSKAFREQWRDGTDKHSLDEAGVVETKIRMNSPDGSQFLL